MQDFILLQKILLSLGIGILIGLERQRRGKGELVAGVRTFTLVCLFGLVSAFISEIFGSNLPTLIAFFATCSLTVCAYVIRAMKTKFLGITTEIAFILTFLIGLLIYYDKYPYFLSVTMGILLTFILVSKESLHKFARGLKRKEIRDAVIFGMITFVILPILPNYTVDPFNALNPYLIWLSLVFVLSISFVGYIAMKIFGTKKGLALTGLFGGLASSTSVAIVMAENVRRDRKLLKSATFAVVVASTTMFLRTVVVSSFFNTTVALGLIVPLCLIATLGYSSSYFIWKKIKKSKKTINIGSPLTLTPALKFALFFMLILLVSKLGKIYFGQMGIYFIALLAGLVEVDAITISLSSLTNLQPTVAINGIIIACLANTFSKWFLVNWIGTRKISMEVGKIFAVLLLVGIAILFSSEFIY